MLHRLTYMLRVLFAALDHLWKLHRWRCGIVPPFAWRRTLIRNFDMIPDCAETLEKLAGPVFRQALADKSRRRRMAVWGASRA